MKCKCYVRGYKGVSAISGFIRWFTFGDYAHVSVRFEIGDTNEEIESIEGKGVIRHAPHLLKDKQFTEYELPMTQEQVLEAHALACSYVGSKYDYTGIYGFLVRKKRHSAEKWFCSEFLAYICWKVRYYISRREPYRETPASVMESRMCVDPMEIELED